MDLSFPEYCRRTRFSSEDMSNIERAKLLLFYITEIIELRKDMTPVVIAQRLRDLDYHNINENDIKNAFENDKNIINCYRKNSYRFIRHSKLKFFNCLQRNITWPPSIFIIHGRSFDNIELKDFLQNRLKIPEPKIMFQEFIPGETLPSKFEWLANHADAAIAILTGDDEGRPVIDENGTAISKKSAFLLRARQNIWIEIGWFWGRIGMDRILILKKENVEIPTDLQGLIYEPYKDKPSEASEAIRDFVNSLKNKAILNNPSVFDEM